VVSESVERPGLQEPDNGVEAGRAMTESRRPVALWQLTLLTLAYFLAGKFGLALAVVNVSVSPVWPPGRDPHVADGQGEAELAGRK